MADPETEATPGAPTRTEVCAYIEEMLLELADMASACRETALAASLALAAVQAETCRRAAA